MDDEYGKIYYFFNNINGKYYIGLSTNSDKRISNHKCGCGGSPLLTNAIKKYGINVFSIGILTKVFSEKELMDSERCWIKFFDTTNRKFGYNITPGGEVCPLLHCDETIKEKHRKNLTIAMNRPETKKKVSENHADVSGENNPMFGVSRKGKDNPFYGHRHAEETKIIMSQKKIGSISWSKGLSAKDHPSILEGKNHPSIKKIFQFSLNGVFIREFFSITEANKLTKINKSNIIMVCRNIRKTAGGFIWKYADDFKIGD